MFGIGMPEMILILAVALIVIGPKKLPDLAKSLGRAMGEFKKATTEFKETMAVDSEISSVKETFTDITEEIKDSVKLDMEPQADPPADAPEPKKPAATDMETGTESPADPGAAADPEKPEGAAADA